MPLKSPREARFLSGARPPTPLSIGPYPLSKSDSLAEGSSSATSLRAGPKCPALRVFGLVRVEYCSAAAVGSDRKALLGAPGGCCPAPNLPECPLALPEMGWQTG